MKNEDLSKHLRRLSRAAEIEGRGRLRFAGRPVPVPHPAAPSKGNLPRGPETPEPAVAESALPEDWRDTVEALQMELYQHGYCRPFDGRRRPEPPSAAPDPSFLQALEQANSGTDRVESDWIVRSVEPSGRLLAEKNGKVRSLQPGEYSTTGWGAPPPGSPVEVRLKKGSLDLQPGFYVVFSDALASPQDGALGALRLYFNVRASGAPALVRAVTEHLNRFQVPFSFKTLTPESYYESRSDAAVLFLHRRFFAIAAHLALDLEARLNGELEAPVPLFTRAVAPGVGLAEDPGSGDSFGLSRCRLLSEGLCLAQRRGETSIGSRLAVVEERFADAGICLENPHLNPRSVDRYELPATEGGPS